MDYGLTEEQEMLKRGIREFVERELPKAYVRKLDETVDFPPQDLWDKLAQIDFFAAAVAREYGGLGLSFLDNILILEELARRSTAVAMAAGTVTGFGARPIAELGTEEQKRQLLPKTARGELKYALGLTEPAGGTDILGAISSYAVKDGDDFVITGQKIFITAAHVADYITTVVITDREAQKRSRALSIFLVDAHSPGITTRLIPKLGLHACGSCEVFYDEVRVPRENLLGTLNNGWYHLLTVLNPERIGVAMLSLGIAEAAFEDALEYAKQRHAFGKPIGQFQAIQHYLSDMATDIELVRNLIYKCAWLCDQGKPFHVEATMAKLVASEAAVRAVSNGMEILGGYSYSMEFDMQRYFRDAKNMTFAPISNEMSKNFLAQCFGLPRSY
jgi:acyl-CoA dehydrogenase